MSNAKTVFAGIDLGTSGVRGVCVNHQLQTIASASIPFDPSVDDRRSPQLWWNCVAKVIRQLVAQVDASRIASIAIDGTSGSMVAVDHAGKPHGKALLYNDPCTDKTILQLIAEIAPDTSAVHGAYSGLARAITLASQHSDTSILHEADWIARQLSGIPGISDENNALKTGYDPVKREWPDWIELTGLPRRLLPRVRAAGEALGPVTRQASLTTGLHTQTLVVAGTTDGCASFLATGAAEPGDGVTVLGSTLTIKLLSDKPVYAPQYGIYSHRIGDRWLAGGASNTGGKVLTKYFSINEIQLLSKSINPTSMTTLDYYPLISPGERFPVNDDKLMPRLEPRPDDDAQFLHGMLQGIAEIEKLGYQRLYELGTPALASLRTVGGGSYNDVWTNIRQRTLNVQNSNSVSEQAAVGTASLARNGFLESNA